VDGQVTSRRTQVDEAAMIVHETNDVKEETAVQIERAEQGRALPKKKLRYAVEQALDDIGWHTVEQFESPLLTTAHIVEQLGPKVRTVAVNVAQVMQHTTTSGNVPQRHRPHKHAIFRRTQAATWEKCTKWIDQLRRRKSSLADGHHTL
jgi:hypothetical protein